MFADLDVRSREGLTLCKGADEDVPVACAETGCEWPLMKKFLDSDGNAGVQEMIDYLNDNMRWLGKYKAKDDK